MIGTLPRSGPRELGLVVLEETRTQTGAGNSDASGFGLTVTTGRRPIAVEFSADACGNTSASGVGQIRIMEGATVLGVATFSFTAVNLAVARWIPLEAVPGERSFKVNLLQAVTGNTQIVASASDPAMLRVVER